MSREAALIGVLVFGIIAVPALASSYETSVTEANPQQVVTNETFSVTEGTRVTLSESKRDVVYNGSVDVYQNNTLQEPDGNYTWAPGNGTLFVVNNTNLNTSENADITYRYTEPTGAQQVSRDIALLPLNLGDVLGIIVGAVLLLTGIVVLGRQR